MDQHRLKGLLLHLLHTGEDHTGNPEEDDVITGDQHGSGIPVVEILGIQIGPTQGGERPQRGAEPSIQHVLFAGQAGAAALFALGRIFAIHVDMTALVAVPSGDLMTPPQLTGDAPVMDILHPVDIGLGKALGNELDGVVLHHADGLLSQRLHLHEPLGGDQGLHVVVAAIAGAHIVAVGHGLDEVALGLQIGNDGLAALVAIHAVILAAVFVDLTVIGDAADNLKVVAQTHLEVVGVMGGGHLHRAGTETDLAVLVTHDGDLAVHDRQDAGLADEVLEVLILGVHGNAGIAHHGLGTGGGHHDVTAAIGERIADMPQVAGLLGVLHLGVRQRRQAVGAPVDDAAALVDETLLVQLAESLADGAGAALVHGEAVAAPVAGSTHLLLLLHDTAAVLLLPCPHALEELLTAQIVASETLGVTQFLFHLDLGGDTCVVAAGQPQSLKALHALIADQNVLQRAVHGVTHVELTRHVGRGHDDAEGFFVGIGLGAEAVVIHPHLIDAALHLPRIIHFRQFFHSRNSLLEIVGKTKNRLVLPQQNRANLRPWYHLYSGMIPHSFDAITPRPDNGGQTVAAYCAVQPKAPGRLGQGFTGTYTNRSLSWHPLKLLTASLHRLYNIE